MIAGITNAKSMESWNYVYDDLNRLLTAANVDTPSLTQSFSYDDIGNITYNSAIGNYTYPAHGTGQPHAVTAAGTRTYQYDAAGRMTSRNGTVLQWNGDGKPFAIGNVGFAYGGTGERLKKVSGGQTTRYIGGDYEIAPDGTVTKYLQGGKQVGTQFFIHHRDHLGSIQSITDVAGAEVRRQDHTPFGDQHFASGSHAESKGWIGELEEGRSSFHLNARFYDPEIGRFTMPDPILRLGQGLNRYSYSWNNPINFLDPNGLDPMFNTKITCPAGGGTPGCPAPLELRSASLAAYIASLYDLADGGDILADNAENRAYNAGLAKHAPGVPACAPNCPTTTNPGEGTSAGTETGGSNPGGTSGDDQNPGGDPKPGCPALGCGSVAEVAKQVVQKFDNDVKLIRKAWVTSASFAIPVGVPVLGAGSSLTTLSTASNVGGRVFWSGSKYAAAAAEAYARATGGQTLEMTFGGRILNAVTTRRSFPYLKPIWDLASRRFAAGASGTVNIFHASAGVRISSTWATVEYGQLVSNGVNLVFHVVP